MTPTLELRAVTKRYADGDGEVTALDGIDLSVAAGELVAIMGPSGSGKSTLLNLAGGLEPPSGGEVLVTGIDLRKATVKELAAVRRRSVGYVFQRFNLVPSLTAIENVMLPLELDGVHHHAARSAAGVALERVGLPGEGLADRYPDDLSGGQQQRVAVARAIVGERRLLLADEPTGALDTRSGDQIVALLADLASAGSSVVLVTHEPRFASWADRVVFVRDGRIVDESAPVIATDAPAVAQ